MGWRVVEFESTPNPNAMKCHLDRAISERPLSYRDADQAAALPLAHTLFEAGATSVLLCNDWLTVNIEARSKWPAMKKAVKRILAAAEDADVVAVS